MTIPDKIYYVGYGANQDLQMVEAIIGVAPKVIGKVAINNVELCVQRYNQISDIVSDIAPAPLSPKQIINGAWGENSNFETYAVRPKIGSNVDATLYELNQLQRDLIAEWELIEFGWYDRMPVTVKLEDGTQLQAETEGFVSGQNIDRVVDGCDYPAFLADPTAMFTTAEKARIDYLDQLKQ